MKMEDSDQAGPTLLTDMTQEGQEVKESSARQPNSSGKLQINMHQQIQLMFYLHFSWGKKNFR